MSTETHSPPLRLGLLVNPIAGIGGPAALKGSDGQAVQQLAASRGSVGRGCRRAERVVKALLSHADQIQWFTWGGAMGADALKSWPGEVRVCGSATVPSTAEDSRHAAKTLQDAGIDLLLFAGGDGTARDIYDVLGQNLPVLGIPAGVKMQSGVFSGTPEAAAEIVRELVVGGLVSARLAQVRDLDESKLQEGQIRSRLYGEMSVPDQGGFLIQTKVGGKESEALVLEELSAYVQDNLPAKVLLGPGSTLAFIKERLGFQGTLLGFDCWERGQPVRKDLDRQALDELDPKKLILIMSFSRGQGVLFGRGNQQLGPEFLRRLPIGNLWILASRTKILSLAGRPLQIDTDDPELDSQFPGLIPILTGYDDRIWYRTAASD